MDPENDDVEDDDDEEAYLEATSMTMVTIRSLEATSSMRTMSLKPRMLITKTLEATTMMMVSLVDKVEAMKKTGDASNFKGFKLSRTHQPWTTTEHGG